LQTQGRKDVVKKRKDLGISIRVAGEKLKPRLQIFIVARMFGPGFAVVLFAENLAQIAIAGRLGTVCHMHLHHRHGEIGAQHHLTPDRVLGDIGAGANVLAIKVKKRLGLKQDVGRDLLRPRSAKGGKDLLADGLFLALAHPRIRRTSATSWSRGTSVWAGWAFHSSWLASAAILAPRIRSLTCTTPRWASSVPWMMATGALRLSAYFNWLPKFLGLPR